MSARYLHDNGDCWIGCTYCAWEDELDDMTNDDTEDDGDTND